MNFGKQQGLVTICLILYKYISISIGEWKKSGQNIRCKDVSKIWHGVWKRTTRELAYLKKYSSTAYASSQSHHIANKKKSI